MSNTKRLVTLNTIALLVLCTWRAEGSGDDNKFEFQTLCGIYQQLEFINSQNEQTFIEADERQFQRARESIEEVDRLLNGSPEKTQENPEEEKEGSETRKRTPVNATTPFGVFMTQVARKAVKKILEKVNEGGDQRTQFDQAVQQAKTALQEAKPKIRQAICGGDSNGEINACTAEAYASTIGAGSTADAGMTLANDIAYLCKTAQGSNECDTGIATRTPVSAKANGQAMYKELITKCKAGKEALLKVNVSSMNEALSTFFARLGMQTKVVAATEKNIGAVLGKYVDDTSSGCGASSHVCINYGARTNAKSQEIPWVKEYREITRKWETVEAAKKTMEHILKDVKRLQDEAWGEYDRAKLAEDASFSEVHVVSSRALSLTGSPGSSSTQTIAQENPAVSLATIPRFFLPWTLLI